MILALVVLGACTKDSSPNTDRFRILKEREHITLGVDRIRIQGQYAYDGAVDGLKLRLGTMVNLHGSEDYEIVLNGKSYSVVVDSLQAGTVYYYAYLVDFGAEGEFVTEVDSLKTLSRVPEVVTKDVLVIDSVEVRIKCEVVYDGGGEVSERGVCWNDYGDPTVDDALMAYPEGGTGEYTCRVSDLQPLTH
ncbi:MAG: hypothetical protein K6A28_06095, partial [Bacteroidales bacterium]|nr:hypothetical protein [Bacteroidales bacterium]